MKTLLLSLALLLLVAMDARAIKISLFSDTNTFVDRAECIMIAKCTGAVPDGRYYNDGLYPVDVDIVSTLKGNRKLGRSKITTIYPMESGKTYLLMSLGGSAEGTNFLAVPELSVVELPATFSLKNLDGKQLVEQVETVFTARRYEVERRLQELTKEKALLEKAVPEKRAAK